MPSIASEPLFSSPMKERQFKKDVKDFMASNPQWGEKIGQLNLKDPIVAKNALIELYGGVKKEEVVHRNVEIQLGAHFLEIWHIIEQTTPAKEDPMKAFAKSVQENSGYTPNQAHGFIETWVLRDEIHAALGSEVSFHDALEYVKNRKQSLLISWIASTQTNNPVLKTYKEKKSLAEAARSATKDAREQRLLENAHSKVDGMSLPDELKVFLKSLYLKKMDLSSIVDAGEYLKKFMDLVSAKVEETVVLELDGLATGIVKGDQALAQRIMKSAAVDEFFKRKVEEAFESEWAPETSPRSVQTEPVIDVPVYEPSPEISSLADAVASVEISAQNTVPTNMSVDGSSQGSRRSARLAAKQAGPVIEIHSGPTSHRPVQNTSVLVLNEEDFQGKMEDECPQAIILVGKEFKMVNGAWQIRSSKVPPGKKRKSNFDKPTLDEIVAMDAVRMWILDS